MRSEVLDPLGLTRTAILTGPYEDARIAQKYMRGEKLGFGDMGFRAAVSFWASAHDLVRFGMFHLGDRLADQRPILSGSTLAAMYASRDPRLPDHNIHLPRIEYDHRGYQVMEFGGHVVGGRVSFRLMIGDGSRVTGTGHISGDVVFGTFPARIPAADTAPEEHHVILDLRLRGHRLVGPVYAESTRRPVFCLPFYERPTRGG